MKYEEHLFPYIQKIPIILSVRPHALHFFLSRPSRYIQFIYFSLGSTLCIKKTEAQTKVKLLSCLWILYVYYIFSSKDSIRYEVVEIIKLAFTHNQIQENASLTRKDGSCNFLYAYILCSFCCCLIMLIIMFGWCCCLLTYLPVLTLSSIIIYCRHLDNNAVDASTHMYA